MIYADFGYNQGWSVGGNFQTSDSDGFEHTISLWAVMKKAIFPHLRMIKPRQMQRVRS
jgi:hypothetical protein